MIDCHLNSFLYFLLLRNNLLILLQNITFLNLLFAAEISHSIPPTNICSSYKIHNLHILKISTHLIYLSVEHLLSILHLHSICIMIGILNALNFFVLILADLAQILNENYKQ